MRYNVKIINEIVFPVFKIQCMLHLTSQHRLATVK